jgi:hypothetical protein
MDLNYLQNTRCRSQRFIDLCPFLSELIYLILDKLYPYIEPGVLLNHDLFATAEHRPTFVQYSFKVQIFKVT